MFYPPKELCKAEAQWGPFDILSILLCLEKGVWDFKFTGGNSHFWNPEFGPNALQTALQTALHSICQKQINLICTGGGGRGGRGCFVTHELCLQILIYLLILDRFLIPICGRNLSTESLRMGWMGWMDEMGYQKCPSIFSLLCTYIEHLYMTYIDNKKLSTTFLWVSKYDVKLGMGVKIFKITICRRLFYFWV